MLLLFKKNFQLKDQTIALVLIFLPFLKPSINPKQKVNTENSFYFSQALI